MRGRSTLVAVLLALAPIPAHADDSSDRQKMIAESIRNYSGNCPCPYNTDRAGRSCGQRSAYSKPGGASPLCYPSDISDAMLKQWRERQRAG
jgi:hypothetical protein